MVIVFSKLHHSIILSTGSFAVLHKCIKQLLSVYVSKTHDTHAIKSVELYIISLLHACISTYHGFKYTDSIYIKDSLDEAHHDNCNKFGIFVIGFFIYDTLASLVYLKDYNLQNHLHHFSSIIFAYRIISNPDTYSIIPTFMITELSTIFLNIMLTLLFLI